MSEVDWTPAVAVLLAGLVVGGLVLWRVMRKGASAAPRASEPLELRDLQGKYQALLAQLRELDDVAGKRTPEQGQEERHALEHAAARVLRDLEAVARSAAPPPRKPKQAERQQAPAPAPAAAPATALQGFLWGVGSVAALGLLFYFVSQQAAPRAPGGSVTGETPARAAAPDDAELQQQRALVAKNPEDVEARLDLVRLLLVRQDMMAVFEETQAVLKRQPGNARALSYQALVRLAMGQAQQAESMLKDALAKDPKLLDAYLHLMLVYVRSQRAADADKVLKDVSQRFPERAEAFRQLLTEMRQRLRDEPQAAEAPSQGEDPHANIGVGGGRAGASEKKVSGTLELHPSLLGRSFGGAIVFVTLREGGFGAGPPLAAQRLPLSAFPMRFEIGSKDSMTGEPLPDDLLIEARIDSDGDPMTRPRTDPYGSADRVRAGSRDVKLVLQPRPSS